MKSYEYIKALPGVLESRPVKVVIDGERYEDCCWYRREFDSPEGCRRPGKYVQEFFYVIGFLPKCEDQKVCYTVEDDRREWYLAGGAYGVNKADRRKPVPISEFNPFGNFFQLSPWDGTNFDPPDPNSKVDEHEPKPYRRAVLIVENQS